MFQKAEKVIQIIHNVEIKFPNSETQTGTLKIVPKGTTIVFYGKNNTGTRLSDNKPNRDINYTRNGLKYTSIYFLLGGKNIQLKFKEIKETVEKVDAPPTTEVDIGAGVGIS